MPKRISKYLGFFSNKFFSQELSKIANSGYAECIKVSTQHDVSAIQVSVVKWSEYTPSTPIAHALNPADIKLNFWFTVLEKTLNKWKEAAIG